MQGKLACFVDIHRIHLRGTAVAITTIIIIIIIGKDEEEREILDHLQWVLIIM